MINMKNDKWKKHVTRQYLVKKHRVVYDCTDLATSDYNDLQEYLDYIGKKDTIYTRRLYNSGLYGWNWSAFEGDEDVYITNSYRNTPSSSKMVDLNDRVREFKDYKIEHYWDNK